MAHAHFRWLNPLPKNTAEVLRSYKKIHVPEVNNGQLAIYLRAMFPGIDPLQHNRINGKALKITELVAKVNDLLGQARAKERTNTTMSQKLKAWRKESIDLLKSGKAPSERARWPALSDDLSSCRSIREVRAAFDKHWPVKRSLLQQAVTSTSATLDDLVRESREARVALEVART